MITREEINQKAIAFEINESNAQRDYIFGWILHGVFTASALPGHGIFLKGGNALRKGYFADTRYSSDLDFGIPNDIDQDVLKSELNKVCDFIQTKTGVTFFTADTKVEEKFPASETPLPDLRVYEARVYFKDFNGQPDHVRLRVSMDITRFDRVILPLQRVPLIHPYSDSADVACTISCMKLEEIIATKLKCLLQRQHAPDLFDYVYSVKLLGGNLDKDEVARTFIQKTIFSRNPQMVKRILHSTPFEYFREAWDKAVVCAQQVVIGVEDAITFFLGDLDGLFNSYADNHFSDFAYFGPELRLAIMHAGRTQTLLKMRYKEEDRIIEPYALKYMEQRNGQQREYFYAFNRSGGSSAPGMRSFVAENVQSIEVTEESFEPQCRIELSKAGEMPEDRFLFDPNKPTRAPSVRRSIFGVTRPTRHSGPRYVYQCTACGRQFTKKRNSSTLGAHKNQGGYPCGGRHGYYVTAKY